MTSGDVHVAIQTKNQEGDESLPRGPSSNLVTKDQTEVADLKNKELSILEPRVMIHLPECKDVLVIHKLSTRLHENNKRISKVKNNDGINK